MHQLIQINNFSIKIRESTKEKIKMRNLNISINEEDLNELSTYCKKTGLSKSKVVRTALKNLFIADKSFHEILEMVEK